MSWVALLGETTAGLSDRTFFHTAEFEFRSVRSGDFFEAPQLF